MGVSGSRPSAAACPSFTRAHASESSGLPASAQRGLEGDEVLAKRVRAPLSPPVRLREQALDRAPVTGRAIFGFLPAPVLFLPLTVHPLALDLAGAVLLDQFANEIGKAIDLLLEWSTLAIHEFRARGADRSCRRHRSRGGTGPSGATPTSALCGNSCFCISRRSAGLGRCGDRVFSCFSRNRNRSVPTSMMDFLPSTTTRPRRASSTRRITRSNSRPARSTCWGATARDRKPPGVRRRPSSMSFADHSERG